MFRREDLVGLVLKGSFQRDPELARISAQNTERVRTEAPEFFLERQRTDAGINKEYSFEAFVLDYDPNSGMFIARGKDFFGDSGLVGTVLEGKIEFMKIYAGRVRLPDDFSRFDVIKYTGTIVKPDAVVTCGGTYQPVRISENYRGIWRLDSQPRVNRKSEELPLAVGR